MSQENENWRHLIPENITILPPGFRLFVSGSYYKGGLTRVRVFNSHENRFYYTALVPGENRILMRKLDVSCFNREIQTEAEAFTYMKDYDRSPTRTTSEVPAIPELNIYTYGSYPQKQERFYEKAINYLFYRISMVSNKLCEFLASFN